MNGSRDEILPKGRVLALERNEIIADAGAKLNEDVFFGDRRSLVLRPSPQLLDLFA